MAQTVFSGLSSVTLRDYWMMILRRKWYILISFLAVFISIAAYGRMQIPLYQASSAVKVMEKRNVTGLFSLNKFFWTPGDVMSSNAMAIKSQSVLERVVRELGFVPKDAAQAQVNSEANALAGQFSTSVMANTNAISIDVFDTNPKRAAAIANKVAEVFVEVSSNELNQQARESREFIEKQLGEVKNNLKKAEDEIKALMQEGGVAGTAGSVQNQILAAQAQKADLLRLYTEQHPDVVKLNEQLLVLKNQLKELPERELAFERLNREKGVHEKLYITLKEKLEEARITEAGKDTEVSLLRLASVPQTPVRPNQRTNFLFAVIAAVAVSGSVLFILENMDTSITTMEEVETYLKLPVFGVIPFLKIELPSILTRKASRLLFFQRRMPRVERMRFQLLSNFSHKSSFIEAYKVLRTNIIAEALNNAPNGKIIMLTSAGSDEGKSITTANLALSFAQEGLKTLLVDADLRKPVVHKIFGLQSRQPGLTDVLLGTAQLEDAVRGVSDVLMGDLEVENTLRMQNIDYLKFLTCGSSAHNPAEILNLQELSTLFEKLRKMFDVVLVDSAPVLAVADSIILAPKADVVILVYKVGRTSRNAIVRTKIQLESVRANVRGIVLNNISPAVELGTTDYYYHYKYYGEPDKVKKPPIRLTKK